MAGLGRRWQGQPVIALVLIMTAWVGARLAVWDSAVSNASGPLITASAKSAAQQPSEQAMAAQVSRPAPQSPVAPRPAVREVLTRPPDPLLVGAESRAMDDDFHNPSALIRISALTDFNPALAWPSRRRPPIGVGMPKPQAEPLPDAAAAPAKDDPRWSGDNWLLMRAGSGAAAQAPGAASYGASQAGAIVRYRLGRGDLHESFGYLRTSLAINAPGKDKEIALGFGVRPVARLPLRVLAEARLQDTVASPMQMRPVATVITELPPQRLPLGFTAEAYAQAGYAGGRGATPFYDAQLVMERGIPGVGGNKRDIRVGAGVWSGGQKGAVRLDVGPRASFRLDLGDINPARIAVDWRFRLAGNARPASGPALTIASSF
ncbi:MAG: hypothetical protein B7Y36_16730 [Novosphingobium sp. 28-62-57]|uniref:hypothetical protein n=1 Tax=unclassified Novosphingobium TaxID=2644732 RepID=UPI000BDA7D38|nr:MULTISPECIES: hypothetical protein [unclassified Novosphingobium]OYW48541.1 MAG: hypothetical protein B7Z34_13300 [Novosphingobium sp. 12-62-10]OYZ08478.1 MAG: hypothetical protein B7Y36_16730 [Novosphingobium sp. 28-62-57]OZA36402.1 MAG: hypothetical protein B7X92_06535 [Novosphingobium sp. 17-62-9]HQS69908.1 hypothetical protein [Novosphingobium sp.]